VVEVQLTRSEEGEAGQVHAPRFPGAKDEFWWLLCGDGADNVLAIKRFAFDARHSAKLRLDGLPRGRHSLLLYFMCDSYLGCDQEYAFEVTVGDGEEGTAEGDAAAMDE